MLTDEQLSWLFHNRISHHNGFSCNRTMRENMSDPPYICCGKSEIIHGKLIITKSCGEPCTFVCKEAYALAQDIEMIKTHEKFIEEARQIKRTDFTMSHPVKDSDLHHEEHFTCCEQENACEQDEGA